MENGAWNGGRFMHISMFGLDIKYLKLEIRDSKQESVVKDGSYLIETVLCITSFL